MRIEPSELTETIYNFITDDDDASMCEALPEEACKEAPRNFLLNSFNGFSTKLAEQLASPGVVLPWLFSTLGVPISFTSFLIPLKNAGSLLPQLFVSARIRACGIRKSIWSGAGFSQGILLIGVALLIPYVSIDLVGYITLVFLLLFSISSGVGSIAFKDVMAKTIPKGKRGRLLATRATGGGILTLAAGTYFYFSSTSDQHITFFVWLLTLAGSLWIIAALLFYFISEKSGETKGGRSALAELKKGFILLKKDRNFSLFLITRGLLMVIPLSQPFLILFAKDYLEVGLDGLGLFVIVSGISATVSSPFWGKFSDRNSKKMMTYIALLGIAILAYVISFSFLPESYQTVYTYSPAFFLMVMAHSGARLSRKTYLIDYAPEQERPLYISVANTTIGIITILSGTIGFIAQYSSITILFLFLILCLVGAAFLSRMLKEV